MNFKQFESHHLVNPRYTSVYPVKKIENRKKLKGWKLCLRSEFRNNKTFN